MNANDVMDALTDMEFPQFKETLERLLQGGDTTLINNVI